MEEEFKKVDLITLLRTFKKEGIRNFVVIRKEKFENNFIKKSKVKEKIEELKEIADEDNQEEYIKIQVLQNLLERSGEDEILSRR